jgi:hypothetical protein
MKQGFQMIEIGFASKVSCKEMNFFPFYFKLRICDIFFPILKLHGLCFGLEKHFIVIQNNMFISILNCSP